MTTLERILTLCALLAVLVAPAGAQQQPEVRARLDNGVVKLGSGVNLLIELEGARSGEIPALPQVQGLRFGRVGTPGVAESFVIENGRQTYQRTLTWRIPLQPTEKGEFTIPSFTVRADGRDLMTRELALRVVEDLKGDELGLLEVDAPQQVWQGEPFWIEIRFGFDAALRNRLNHYNLSLPWLGELSGLVELEAPPIGAAASAGKILLNARRELEVEGLGTRQVGDTSFLLLRVRKRFVATRSGALEFPTSNFEFGRREDAFSSMFNRGGEEFVYFKRFPPFRIDVKPVPDEGRPLEWSGAVGRFEAAAIADRRDVTAGDSIKLTVEWTGEGNLEFFDAPDIGREPAFGGFRVYGTQDRRAWDRRSIVYDIAPVRPDVTEIPPVPLSVFDTQTGKYARVLTKPIPIRVRPLEGAAGLADLGGGAAGTTLDIRDIQTAPERASPVPAPSGVALLFLWAGLPTGWLLLRGWVRRRGDPATPRARARRRARRELARALAQARTPAEQADALHAFLAARTGEPEEAWIGRDPRAWLAERADDAPRLAEEDARTLAGLVERLDRAVWGGEGGKVDEREVLAVADRLAAGGL